MRRLWTVGRTAGGLVLGAGLALAALPAAAQSCAALVDRFAADQGLTAGAPPVAAPAGPGGGPAAAQDDTAGGAVSPDRLAQSGGVIAPPPSGGGAGVIEPPQSGSSNMPTAPAVRPDATPGGSGATGGTMGQAARNAQIESLVTAARQAARTGDESRCMDSLEEARRLSQTAPGGSGG